MPTAPARPQAAGPVSNGLIAARGKPHTAGAARSAIQQLASHQHGIANMTIDIAGGAGAPSDRSRSAAHGSRVALVLALGTIEFVLTSWLFDFPSGGPRWTNPVFLLRLALLTGLLALTIFAIVIWPNRKTILADWSTADEPGRLRKALAVNFALFALLLPATALLSDHAAVAASPPWHLLAIYCPLLFATGVSIAAIYAPLRFWLSLAHNHALAALAAVAAATVVKVAGIEAQQGWNGLASATLAISYQILASVDPSISVVYETQRLQLHNFWVIIDASCSGYEGVSLVSMFMALYLFVFRQTLRFPAALILLPLGICAIWLLNAVRIAILVLIGAYISPDIALKGFHSQAGWLAFLLVTIAIMAAAHRMPLFNSQAASFAPADAHDRIALALLAPFMALMIGHIAVAASAPQGEWLITLKLALTAAVLWYFRDVYRGLSATVCPLAVSLGLAIAIAWIATAPITDRGETLAAFIAAQPAALVAAWLIIRVLVGVLIVPVAEELAFRGFLYSFIATRGPVTANPTRWSILAIVVTSLLFGALHERWLAGALAGALFALIMLRRGRIADAVVAHVTANAVIMGWAIAARQWWLI